LRMDEMPGFIQFRAFTAAWDKLGCSNELMIEIERIIAQEPEIGTRIQGGGGMRKFRVSDPASNRGKSGGYRVFFAPVSNARRTFLLIAILSKTEMANLPKSDIVQLAAVINAMQVELKNRGIR
jgi:hypothetical protein